MQRELASFPLTATYRLKLQQAGFVTVQDLTGVQPDRLAKELSLSEADANRIIETVFRHNNCTKARKGTSFTALDLLKDEESQQSIVTFSERLDSMLGGGIPVSKLTEICGAAGIGKTQMCMQLAVDVQIPECFGGVEGESVYVDTEHTFIIQRVVEITRGAIGHCQHVCDTQQDPDYEEAMKKFTLEEVLSHIYYFRCKDHQEVLSLVTILPEFLKTHPRVKIVLLDSIAFNFRHEFEDYLERTRVLGGLAQRLIKIAADYKLAVVLTNQMTTKISSDPSTPSRLVPALGESWSHAATVRLILERRGGQRYAHLSKSPSRPEASVPYQITTGGIRDVHREEGTPAVSGMPSTHQGAGHSTAGPVSEQSRKRKREEDGR